MSDALPSLTDALKPAPKRRGRKPGGGKVPGSGRKPGVKNKVSHDMKTVILTRGKPLELLCDISRGVKVRVGPQAGPGEPQYAYPSLQERAAAAKILLDKLVPAAAVSKLDDEGTDAFICASVDKENIAEGGVIQCPVGDKHLRAVDYIMVTFFYSAGFHAFRIRA